MYTTTNSNAAGATSELKSAGDKVARAARDTANDIGDAARNAGRNVRDFIDTASHEVSRASSVVTTQIEDRPVQATMVALAVGFLLGSLWRR